MNLKRSTAEETYPPPYVGAWTAGDFAFHSGEILPELTLGYLTIGDRSGEPVLLLHGSNATADNLMTPAFAGELFGTGQPLDAGRHFIVVPDAIGLGRSSKPSDGLRQQFPKYNYDDLVDAQYRLVTEHLGIDHLRLVMGNSMGGMLCWVWSVRYPQFMDAIVPMACQPSPVAGRNQMMRRLAIETIRTDPGFRDGNYLDQPRSVKLAEAILKIGFNGGELALLDKAPTGAAADAFVAEELAQPAGMDANDFIYRFAASRDYDPEPYLDRIQAAVLAINAADDERNPPQNGTVERAVTRLKNGRLLLIPAGTDTSGHGTTANARFYKDELGNFLTTAPRRVTSRTEGTTRSQSAGKTARRKP